MACTAYISELLSNVNGVSVSKSETWGKGKRLKLAYVINAPPQSQTHHPSKESAGQYRPFDLSHAGKQEEAPR